MEQQWFRQSHKSLPDNNYFGNYYDNGRESSYAWLSELLEPYEEEERRKEAELRWRRRQARLRTSPKTLLDRMTMNQSEYMDMLSVPRNPDAALAPKPKKEYCFKCGKGAHPVVQLSVPKKLRAIDIWRQYEPVLPTERIRRFDAMWRTGYYNLEPRDVRYYLRQTALIEGNYNKRRRKRKKKKKKSNNMKINKKNRKKQMRIPIMHQQSLFF